MKKMEKDFILAWVLGMVLPAVILGAMLGLEKSGNEKTDSAQESAVSPINQISVSDRVTVPVLLTDGSVREMDLENYLCGVVLAEMPVDFEKEALKAQSVVARTYVLRRLHRTAKHGTGAVCTDPACCQGYVSAEAFLDRGGTESGISKVCQAVLETAGEVLLYDGKLIDATYFSCSGGMTEDAAAVWGNDVPYLQSTVSPGEEQAAYYSDTLSLTPDQVEYALGTDLFGDPEDWFTVLSLTEGGGVHEISVCGEIFTGVELRKFLSLRSTNFTVRATENEIVFHTKGYGHRVGMSQYGADAMAVAGSTYDEILAHYYTGTTLTRWQSGN